MTVTVSEFIKNFSRYEAVAMNEPVIVRNSATGVEFIFKGKNPMGERLENMKKGKGISFDKIKERVLS